MDIIMTGYAGLAESRRLAFLCLRQEQALRRHLPRRVFAALADAETDSESFVFPPDACCRTPVGEGGVWAALWHLADAAREELGLSPAGLHVLQSKIPIRQETVEICELLDRDPYRIPSGGWLFVLGDGRESGGTVIGKLTRSSARTVQGAGGIRYLERPADRRPVWYM